MTKQIKDTRERGVALLFALGLLALMSVLGVAFVTNALNAQKTAVNIGSRNQARLLLDSAINRVMIGITAALHQRVNADLSQVYSSGDGSDRGGKNDDDSRQDLLNDEEGRMRIFIPGQNMYKMSDSKSTWVYVRDAEDKVIGRMAYQVLPQGKTTISLNDVLLGVYNHEEWSSNHGEKGSTGSTTIRSSWNSRVGRDISELNFEPAFYGNSEVSDSSKKTDSSVKIGTEAIKTPALPFLSKWTVQNTLFANINKIYTAPYSKTNPFFLVSSFNEFFAGSYYKDIIANKGSLSDNEHTLTKELQQTWFRRWFDDGKGTFPEAFYRGNDSDISKTSVLHRFNLGHIEGDTTGKKWYDATRFANCSNPDDANFQNKDVVDWLFKDAADFIPGDDKIHESIAGSGLPFLGIIGNDQGSFADLKDRRRQIAANLNDYCDEDSIPTSDISAEEWSGPGAAGPGKMPQYTGNEKTPYINEFVLGVKLENFVSLFGSSAAGSIKFDLVPNFYTELIDIYGGATADYELKSWFSKLAYEIEVTAKVKVTFEDDSTEEVENVNSKLREGTSLNIDTPFSSAVSKDANDASAGFQDGYWVVVNDLKDQKIAAEFQIDDTALKDKMTASNKDKGIKNRELVSYKVTVKKVTLGLAAVGLFSTTGTKPGVDFVKGPSSAIESTGEVVFELDKTNKPVTATTAKDWDTFYLSGMEVRDPRQNLNFVSEKHNPPFIKSENTQGCDWKCDPVLKSAPLENNSDYRIGSIDIKADGKIVGTVNSCSNPSKPFSSDDLFNAGEGTPGTDFDKENATDPAAAGPDNPRLSTAYIANAPMRSLWELGAIHRGKAWQTINLKWAGGIATDTFTYKDNEFVDITKEENHKRKGISYKKGDGGILDQVKLTSKTHSSGKVNVNMLHTYSDEEGAITDSENKTYKKYPVFKDWDKTIIRALLYNIHYNQQLRDIRVDAPPVATGNVKKIGWNDISDVSGGVIEAFQTKPASDYLSRAAFIGKSTEDDYFGNAFGIIAGWDDLADAQKEEFIGKTINLLTAEQTAPTTIRAIVVVQTIKSINAENGTEITKTVLNSNNIVITESKPVTKKDFDFKTYTDTDGKKKYIYFDEITSELRALVTFKKVQKNGAIRLQLHSIQYY